MIAAQGPIENTKRNFWKLAFQERVGIILALAKDIPGDCALYYPVKVGHKEQYGEFEVTLRKESQPYSYIKQRDLTLRDSALKDKSLDRSITHYHFTGWEDWQLPEGNSRESLEALTDISCDFVIENFER